MKLFNAHRFEIRILDDELSDPDELLMWVCEAISLYCEVRCVEGTILEYKGQVISTDGFDIADA